MKIVYFTNVIFFFTTDMTVSYIKMVKSLNICFLLFVSYMRTIGSVLIGLYYATWLCFFFDRETNFSCCFQFYVFSIKIQSSSKFLLVFIMTITSESITTFMFSSLSLHAKSFNPKSSALCLIVFEIMVISLYWFAAQQQTSIFRWQNFDLFYPEFSAELKDLTVNV